MAPRRSPSIRCDTNWQTVSTTASARTPTQNGWRVMRPWKPVNRSTQFIYKPGAIGRCRSGVSRIETARSYTGTAGAFGPQGRGKGGSNAQCEQCNAADPDNQGRGRAGTV